jgi:anaerobic selenocysteine-containing dehydrogenase
MAALTALSVTLAGATPAPVAVSASDTIAEAQMGANGCKVRVINAGGSPDVVTIVDPSITAGMGSVATSPTVSVPATTGIRMIDVPRSALNSSGVATLQHSFTTTVTIEVYKY